MTDGRKTGERPRVVVITGASAGLGRATARAFARTGAHVGLIARGRKGLEGALRDVEERGGRGVIAQADVADPDQVEAAADEVERVFGPIDVWVNNAMVSVFSPVKETSAAEFRRVTEVTYLGYVHGTLTALKRMLARDAGVIVQVGSALVYRSIPLQAAYCAAKHAVMGFTESLRCELLHDKSNVHVTIVQMPALNTPQFAWSRSRMPRKAQPVPPIYQPEVGAKAIVWAARHAKRREARVGGSTSITVIGNKLAPALGDRFLARTGYAAQQINGAIDPLKPDNLWRPLDADIDYGADGSFERRAHRRSAQWWATTHRGWLLLGAAALAAVAHFRYLART